MADRYDISQRKRDHIALCAGPNVGFRDKTTLFEHVKLVHCALPEMHADDVDTTTTLLGRKMRAPVIIASMTGGTAAAAKINQDLARVADDLGLGFGLGSQRAMFERPDTASTFQVRDVAPNVFLTSNLGLVQAKQMSTGQIQDLVGAVRADALCVHLNPAMEIVQPGGDRDFSGGLDVFGRLVDSLRVPIIAKETGCGLSRVVAKQLRSVGVRAVDVSGAGGTSWVAVEAHRATDPAQRNMAEELWDWGIPTAASVLQMQDLGLEVIATGGVKTGSDVARALALGATVGGIAAQALRAHTAGGAEGVQAFLQQVIDAVRAIMLLTGCRTVDELRRAPRVISGELAQWSACAME
jgi:isopentenyl-diphosphate Delta-isomerase